MRLVAPVALALFFLAGCSSDEKKPGGGGRPKEMFVAFGELEQGDGKKVTGMVVTLPRDFPALRDRKPSVKDLEFSTDRRVGDYATELEVGSHSTHWQFAVVLPSDRKPEELDIDFTVEDKPNVYTTRHVKWRGGQ